MKKVQGDTSSSNELCVLCGKDTGVTKSTDINEREFFVIGCGQLCSKCYFSYGIYRSDID